jgi:ubiquinone/menaquinone biosynthesis C-methylase UbiE
MKKFFPFLLLAGCLFSGIGYAQHANDQMNQTPFNELVKQMERPDRDWWQKPGDVIAMLAPLKGRRVVDLGCGTGYFSFRLIDSGATVIAADIDERFLAYVDSVREQRGISKKTLQTRKVPADNPMLEKKEADIVLIVNTFHHFDNRVEYLKKVKYGLKSSGFIMVVDYFKKDLPLGPKPDMKQTADEVIRDLKMAGFSYFKTEETKLPYQYIVLAM